MTAPRPRWHALRIALAAGLAALTVACVTVPPVQQAEVLPALAPDEPARAALAAVQALPADAAVVLVGHEPGISAIGALLVGNPGFEALGKAEAVRIVDGQLRWRCAWDAEAPVR